MQNTLENFLLVCLDFFAIALSFILWSWLRNEMGFFSETRTSTILFLTVLVFLFWLMLFSFFGLYTSWKAKSRVDEFITIFKAVSIGVLIIFLITFDMDKDLAGPPNMSRMFIVNYWLILLCCVTMTRMLYRTVQRSLLVAGVGHRRTIIVGWGRRGRKLADELAIYPALGHKVIGFVSQEREGGEETSYKDLPLLGDITEIDRLVFETKTQEVIFALAGDSRKKVMHVVNQCNGVAVNFKVVPDLYDIVLGQTRTNQIYGLPLIDIMPDFMPVWERRMKRLGDIVISGLILAAFLPIWMVVAAAIKLNSKGPVLYKQIRVGRDCQPFSMYKFRSMCHDAESQSGPQWATHNDPRITHVGRFLRATRLDEIPQFMNVLKGEMSLIGPRPERPYFVEQFRTIIPFYLRRFRVRPGITGWAQIKSGYDSDIDNVKMKLQYDLFYLENMSLRMDLKIILHTLYIMIRGKGQ